MKQKHVLIHWWQFWPKTLSLIWRLPTVIRSYRHMGKIAAEDRESWGSMLEASAARFPANAAIKSHDGNYSWKTFNEATNRLAHYFISRGLKKGDTAAVFLENRPELLMVYSAMGKLGVCSAMINTNLRGAALHHCLTLNPAAAFIVGEEVVPAFEAVRPDLDAGEGSLYYVKDKGPGPVPPGYVDLEPAAKAMPTANPATTAGVKPSDAIAYVFTSGTTGGMPKAAVIMHGRLVRGAYFNGRIVLSLGPGDTMYVPLPFFHTNALALSWPAVFLNGSAVALRRKFSASNFWSDVDTFQATAWCYIGELCRYLMNQPPRGDDRDHPLTKIIGNGLRPDLWKAFKKRFNIEKVFEIYGAAESNLYFVNLLNLDCTQGFCIAPHSIVAYDVEEDEPVRGPDGRMRRVAKGATGLLLGEISARYPFAGYTNRQATEAKIIRGVFADGDAWFNTGDLVRDIGYGHIQFVDRTGDTFRWKGENVSTTEVEKVADSFEGIALSTAYGVAMPGGDGKAGMLAAIPDGRVEDFDVDGLADHFRQALPSYAVPKFLRLKTELAQTPTHKIKKIDLKKEGFDPLRVADPLYVLLPDADGYTPLTSDVYDRIHKGAYRF